MANEMPIRPDYRTRFKEGMKRHKWSILAPPLYIGSLFAIYFYNGRYWLVEAGCITLFLLFVNVLLYANLTRTVIINEDRGMIDDLDHMVKLRDDTIDRVRARSLSATLFATVKDVGGQEICVYVADNPNLHLVVLSGPELHLANTGKMLNSPSIAQLNLRGNHAINHYLELQPGLRVNVSRVDGGPTLFRFYDVASRMQVLLTDLDIGEAIPVGTHWLIPQSTPDAAHAEIVRVRDNPQAYYEGLPGRVSRAAMKQPGTDR